MTNKIDDCYPPVDVYLHIGDDYLVWRVPAVQSVTGWVPITVFSPGYRDPARVHITSGRRITAHCYHVEDGVFYTLTIKAEEDY